MGFVLTSVLSELCMSKVERPRPPGDDMADGTQGNQRATWWLATRQRNARRNCNFVTFGVTVRLLFLRLDGGAHRTTIAVTERGGEGETKAVQQAATLPLGEACCIIDLQIAGRPSEHASIAVGIREQEPA